MMTDKFLKFEGLLNTGRFAPGCKIVRRDQDLNLFDLLTIRNQNLESFVFDGCSLEKESLKISKSIHYCKMKNF